MLDSFYVCYAVLVPFLSFTWLVSTSFSSLHKEALCWLINEWASQKDILMTYHEIFLFFFHYLLCVVRHSPYNGVKQSESGLKPLDPTVHPTHPFNRGGALKQSVFSSVLCCMPAAAPLAWELYRCLLLWLLVLLLLLHLSLSSPGWKFIVSFATTCWAELGVSLWAATRSEP